MKKWIKIFPNSVLYGTISFDLSNLEFGVFIKLLCISALSPVEGEFLFKNYNQLASKIGIKGMTLKKIIERLEKTDRITIEEMNEYIKIKINNYFKYQSGKETREKSLGNMVEELSRRMTYKPNK